MLTELQQSAMMAKQAAAYKERFKAGIGDARTAVSSAASTAQDKLRRAKYDAQATGRGIAANSRVALGEGIALGEQIAAKGRAGGVGALNFLKNHKKAIGRGFGRGAAVGAAVGGLAGLGTAAYQVNEANKTASYDELEKQAAYDEYMESPITYDEVGIAKEAAAQLYEDCLNKLAFAEQLFGEADNLEKSAADNGPGVAVPYVNQMNTPVGMQQNAQPTAAKGLNLKDPGTLGDAQFANAGALNQFLDEFRNARAQEAFAEQGQADPLAGSLSGGAKKTASLEEFVVSRYQG